MYYFLIITICAFLLIYLIKSRKSYDVKRGDIIIVGGERHTIKRVKSDKELLVYYEK